MSNAFPASRNGYVCFFFHFINAMYYVNWFSHAELSMAMAYNLFNVVLNLVC